MKKYWGVVLIALTVLMSSCVDTEEVTPSYTSYGDIIKDGESIVVDVDGFLLLHFSAESIGIFGENIEDGDRVFVYYEMLETLEDSAYLIEVLSMAEVDRKVLEVIDEDNTDTLISSLIVSSPVGVVSGNNINLQIDYLEDHETNIIELIYRHDMQEEGENVKLVLVNMPSGDELDEEDYDYGFNISTFDISAIRDLHTQGETDNVYFDLVINPNNTYYESTIENLSISAE